MTVWQHVNMITRQDDRAFEKLKSIKVATYTNALNLSRNSSLDISFFFKLRNNSTNYCQTKTAVSSIDSYKAYFVELNFS